MLLTAAAGTASAVGGLASAGAEKTAQVNNYKRQLKIRSIEWDRSRAMYGQKVSEANEQLDENFMAASRGFAAEQSQLNDLYNQASVSLQNDFAKIAEKSKYYGSGKTADRLAARDMAAFGRAQALTASNLVRAGESYDSDVANIRQQLKTAQRKTVAPVMFKPQPGLPPVKPNTDMTGANLSFIGSMIGTGLDSYSAYKSSQNLEHLENNNG
ncbi:hypothetical protein [uncultured phage MedDCM-OCT-S08-C41]|uniref:Internal virion protein n=1 Tax=uncultured phage MedDCM-OCT-S08-C41 TaxID=743578 RepID=D6PIC7_9CAUD|nr:hypothetical protein HOT88_gp02 [uncultured phage MedDCM-OCT-S08-C41]ADD95478.1 hypothetical protein [uncultured phage MedDCM-OCT-S08-C41]